MLLVVEFHGAESKVNRSVQKKAIYPNINMIVFSFIYVRMDL